MLFDVLGNADQALVDPARDGEAGRFLLDEVLFGRRRAEEAIDAVCGQASRIIGRLRDGTLAGGASLPVAARRGPMARNGAKNRQRTGLRPMPSDESGHSNASRRRGATRSATVRSTVVPEVAAPVRRRSAKQETKANGSRYAVGKPAGRGEQREGTLGPAKYGSRRGKTTRIAAAVGDAQRASSADTGTRLKIPFGNKELAMRLGARYSTGWWLAPPGTNL